ncbi:YncE family protein [Streptomyces sp. NPDC014623]|uniref:YncE family protein n=1 Tax=Streptomyces sp. NPDC014623 TaxID=3364875 RepID=UPI003700E2D7
MANSSVSWKDARLMAHRKVYLAVGRTNTRIYRFDPIDGDTRVVENVPAYEAGYTALGAQYHGEDQEPLLLAVSRDRLITIDVTAGTLKDQVIDGLPSGPWFDGDMDPDGKTLFVVSNPDVHSYAIDVAARKAVPRNAPGGGRWDDFAYHPKDGRLLSVEGDNGDLLLIDPGRQPMKTVLREGVFPPAEASAAAGSRKSYSATFFDQDGNFYAVDSAGNVNHLDLTTATIPDHSQRIGRGRVPVGALEIVNGAGRITPLPAPPSYDEIAVSKKFNRTWENSEPRGRVYSFELTLTAVSTASGRPEDVKRFRISFDLPTVNGAKAEASGVQVIAQDGKAYLESVADQFLAAGTSRPITVQITVPGDPTHLPREYPLDGLKATRLPSH